MFRPSLHGWPFRNVHACTGPELGTSTTPPELGLGGGMCWAALDRYLRGVEIPRDTRNPDEGDPLHAELVERQIAAIAGLWPRIAEWQSAPAGSWRDRLPLPVPFGGRDVASRVRTEWRSVRRRLDADRPVLLTLLPEGGAYDRARTVRQVLATGWSRSGSRVTLSIYDPDRPEDDDVDLLFSLSGELKARLTGGIPIRGFFPVDYDRTPTPMVRVSRFDDRSVIGLNRTVRGEPAMAGRRKQLDMVARNERGALLHFHRSGAGRWEGTNVMDVEGLGAYEIHCDPVAVRQPRALHVFGRDYAGDLLHFRKGRSWSVTNCTDQKRAGARFRVVGRPVPLEGPKLQLNVIGRDNEGGLVHYRYAPLRGWRAEQIPGDPVAGDPVAVRHDDTIHVAALARDGRLLHWFHDEAWTMTDPDAGPGPAIRMQGRPAMIVTDGRVHVIGRGRHNRLILLRLDDGGLWQRQALAGNLAGDPRATLGPDGVHLFAADADGGLVHAWRDGAEWVSENVVESRSTLTRDRSGEAGIAAWGTDRTLRAFVHSGDRLRVYSWTPDADWACDPVPGRAGTPPVAFRDGRGEPHLVLTDRLGTVVHIEPGAWQEPGRSVAAAKSTAAAKSPGKAKPVPAADAAVRPEAAAKDEPAAADEPAVEVESLPIAHEEPSHADEPLVVEPEAEAQESTDKPERVDEPEPPDSPAALPKPEPEPAEEVLDFDAARLIGRGPAPEAAALPRPEPEPEPEPQPQPQSQSEEEPEPDEGQAAGIAAEEDADVVFYEDDVELDLAEDDDWDPRPPAGLPGLPDAAGGETDAGDGPDDWEPRLELAEETDTEESERPKPTERPVRKFRWEDRKPAVSPDDVEPMDLSLLDSWPPPSRGGRPDRQSSGNGRGSHDSGKGDG